MYSPCRHSRCLNKCGVNSLQSTRFTLQHSGEAFIVDPSAARGIYGTQTAEGQSLWQEGRESFSAHSVELSDSLESEDDCSE